MERVETGVTQNLNQNITVLGQNEMLHMDLLNIPLDGKSLPTHYVFEIKYY
jgi:hypothetical protein